jgi:long-chain acyl-CoA synthetase
VTGFHENLITPEQAVTLDGLFAQRVKRSGERLAYQGFDRRRYDWVAYSWVEMAGQVGRWQQALQALGLQSGDRVAILLRNCPEWVMFDQAAMSLGLVVVPLYTDDRPDNTAYILQDAGVRLLLIQDLGRWQRLAAVLPDEHDMEVVVMEGREAVHTATEGRLRYLHDWLPDKPQPLVVREDADPHGLASIVYTSGTTGRPKGVMLSHHNMLSVAHGTLMSVPVFQEDLLLSFLPLSHTFERTVGYYLPIMAGAAVVYARSVSQLAEDLVNIRPTAMIAVPRIFEKVHDRIREGLARKPLPARWLFNTTVAVGWRRFLYQQGRGPWHASLLSWPLLERLVASKVQARLGGRLRLAVSGGAAITPQIARFFIGLNVPLVQGYGLTETAPVVTANSLTNNVPDSVGMPLRNLEVCIGDQDELLVRGPGVMLGYWNNHKATAQVIAPNGWLHTGDQARIDDTGHVYITGRLKDILVLSNGEKIPPADMESALCLDPLFEQAMVVGEGRPYLTALLVLDAARWPVFAQSVGVDPKDPQSLRDERIQRAVIQHVRDGLRAFPGYAKIRRVTLLLQPWTVDDDLLTPTLKIKRAKVLECCEGAIEAMYSES